jgi:hypothetical protein
MGTDTIVETTLKKPIPVLVASHSRPISKPFYTTFFGQFDIKAGGIEAARKAISDVFRTQASSLCALI